MLEAVVFDFDGVVVDSEPAHMAGFLEIMRPYGVSFTEEEYYSKYLSYSDRAAMLHMDDEYDLKLTEADIQRLIAAKSEFVTDAVAAAGPLPGALELMREIRAAGIPLAICSAALGHEVRMPMRAAGALDLVQLIIAAEDVKVHKPDPQGYIVTMQKLGEINGVNLTPANCVAIEDSPGGLQAAKNAGMLALGVTNTVSAKDLPRADKIADSLADIHLEDLKAMVQ